MVFNKFVLIPAMLFSILIPRTVIALYEVVSESEKNAPKGWEMQLDLKLIAKEENFLGPDAKNLTFISRYEGPNIIHVKIMQYVDNTTRWEIPNFVLPRNYTKRCTGEENDKSEEYRNPRSVISYSVNPFGFAITLVKERITIFNSTPGYSPNFIPEHSKHAKVNFLKKIANSTYNRNQADVRKSCEKSRFEDNQKLDNIKCNSHKNSERNQENGKFSASNDSGYHQMFNSLIFKDQYLEISTQIPENLSLFGFGERIQSKGMKLERGKTYVLWNTDTFRTDEPMYGSHPFFLAINDGICYGVLLLNSNGMEIRIEDKYLKYKVQGGIFDFYFFTGPYPSDVMQQYTKIIGRPAAIPYWSLGFHQSRYGYRSVDELEKVVASYKNASIPLDVIWSDIDYMDKFRDFTTDPATYPIPKFQKFVESLHSKSLKFVPILDCGISNADSRYESYKSAEALDIFVKDAFGKPYSGQTFAGSVNWPDFFHPSTYAWWKNEIESFHKKIAFDGLWIDLNEVSSFCNGTVCSGVFLNNTDECMMTCKNYLNKWDNPPWTMKGLQGGDAGWHTIALSAKQYGNIRMYDSHNLYGLMEAQATWNSLYEIRKRRPFVLVRSTFPGSGRSAAHWTGDNNSTWESLRFSIQGILNAGMFGIPMTGADICGFTGNTTAELCARWIQLGAFYPFARNHNILYSIPQELYRWPAVEKIGRDVLRFRYRLLPFLYTLAFESHSSGNPIMRPLWWHFFHLTITHSIDNQFLLGDAILVSPVLEEGASHVRTFFPPGIWYNMFDFKKVSSPETGVYKTLFSPLNTIQVHARGGKIIPMQGGGLTTSVAKRTPFTLLVFLPPLDKKLCQQKLILADGKIFLDDGERIPMSLDGGSSSFVELSIASSFNVSCSLFLSSAIWHPEYAASEGLRLSRVQVFGLDGSHAPGIFVFNNNTLALEDVEFRREEGTLDFPNLNISLAENFTLSWDLSL